MYTLLAVAAAGISAYSFRITDVRNSLESSLRAKQRLTILMSSQSISVNTLIDLRSDTVTIPSSSMRQRMLTTAVGDDVFGEDPTINELETRVAEMFGKESSLFFPSGTMSNLAAVMSWCGTRGSEIILGDTSHIHLFEQAGTAQIAGVGTRTIPNKRDGTMNIDAVEAAIRSDNVHFPVTELIAIENTHNYCGGRVLPAGYMEALCWMAHQKGVPVHLDGARIWNAATSLNQPLADLVHPVDSISACLSKGLGAPVGSLLIGPQALIKKARRARKALGGGMRQAGLLAAAGLQALDDFGKGMLKGDHERAQIIAHRLSELPGLNVDVEAVDTNIVLVHLENSNTCDPSMFSALLRERGVLVLPFGPSTIRIVTHRDITDRDVENALVAFRDVAARVWANSPHYLLDGGVIDTSNSAVEVKPRKFLLDTTIEDATPTVRATEIKDKDTAAKPTPTPITQFYEEVCVYGMSVSEQGFCVLLKGLICDRLLKVLVTPADPMSDGLDRERCESSEAVTLLQLLQGIDVESYLAKDALSNKFSVSSSSNSESSSASGGAASAGSTASSPTTSPSPSSGGSSNAVESSKPKKYELKRVVIDEVSDGKKAFMAKLVGVRKSRSAASATSPSVGAAVSNVELLHNLERANGEEAASRIGAATTEVTETASPDNMSRMPSADDSQSPPQALRLFLFPSASGGTSTDSTAPPVDWSATYTGSMGQSNSVPTASPTLKVREVEVKSAFEAIALALRHKSAIEVRSDLLQNEEISYSLDELTSFFPRLLVSEEASSMPNSFLSGMDGSVTGGGIGIGSEGINYPVNQRGDYLQFEIDRLQRQYNEAVRQKNDEKIEMIRRRLESTLSSASGGDQAETSRSRPPQLHIQQQGGYQ